MRTRHVVFCLLLALSASAGCSSNQPVKNTWKGTKDIWFTYVNRPASIDYEDTGKVSEYELRFSKAIMGIDERLHVLERTMQNADKPPTPEWLNVFFTQFPWVDGIIGLNGEGGLVGQAGRERKDLDFSPLLEHDPKQKLRALRGNVQITDFGAECMLGVPLYDGVNFLGVVVAYFDIRSLMRYSEKPEDVVVTSPAGLLWSGQNIGGDLLAGENWAVVTRSKSSGNISSKSGNYIWVSRFLGNYPLIFAALKNASSTVDTVKEEKKSAADRTLESAVRPPHASDSGFLSGELRPQIDPLPEL